MEIEGLTTEEFNTYKHLLTLKRGTVSEIAHLSGEKRSNLYRYLESLLKKGLVSEVYEGKKHIFIAESPKSLLKFISKGEEQVKSLIPDLEAIESHSQATPKIRVFEGLEGVRRLYDELLEEGQEILAFAWPEKLLETIIFHDETIVAERLKRKVSTRVIYPDTPAAHRRKNDLKEARYVKNLKEFDMVFMMSGNKVIMFSLKRWITGVLIDNKEIADGLRAFFDAFWMELK